MTVKEFNGMQYLAIDIANQQGLDKLSFEDRIKWVKDNIENLESFTEKADKPPLYAKAVMALRKSLRGEPTGHLVGLDAKCSGVQVMSALTGCIAGLRATGLIDPDRPADAYTDVTTAMNVLLEEANHSGVSIDRADAKHATMTSFYASKATPKRIFGDGSPEYQAFLDALKVVAPGAYRLLQILLDSWNPNAYEHSWTLPDGFSAKVKVMQKVKAQVEVQELGGSKFTYQFYENAPQDFGLSNVANCVHSFDAMLLREMHRRCNYDRASVAATKSLLMDELRNTLRVSSGLHSQAVFPTEISRYITLWEQSKFASAVVLPHISKENVHLLPTEYIQNLLDIINMMETHKPFKLVTIHDDFESLANYCNYTRMHYRNILAEITESECLSFLLTQMFHKPVSVNKPKNISAIATYIRNSNYGLG